ncbi:transcription factor gsfR2 [Trichoderma asperellum]|uniref:Transcription factor gsfR2 n=1 Tax=Trichoderma asperellum TaxID=101201 RepID=A0A6V8QL21_TRIAP|nr:transcription factor gsfR2 [Trichoderma asperellum]
METAMTKEADYDPRPQPAPFQRQRACIPCTRAKRRCDKSRPFCQRCLSKQIKCHYSSRRLYARGRGDGSSGAESIATASEPSLDSSTSLLFTEDGNAHEDEDESTSQVDVDVNNRQLFSRPWFLKAEYWVIHHQSLHTPPSIRSSAVQQYIRCIKKWLRQWVDCSHCPIVHASLFAETGMPPCLQDAYAALAVYGNKNEQNEHVVMQHIQDKADALLEANSENKDPLVDMFASSTPLSTGQHLARVLSLFIYQFIRLFDGHIRQRALAEKQIAVLEAWTTQLWESVTLDVTLHNTFGGEYLAVEDKIDMANHLWRNWIVMENVRRVWMVCTYTQCIYLLTRDGTVTCTGTIDFTARHGLWDATSAAIWLRMLEQKDPLSVVPHDSDWLREVTTIKDIDPFSIVNMGLGLDSDKMDAWIANTTNMRLEALMDA